MSMRFPKPAASRRVHMFAAGLLWTLVGILLAASGTLWVLASGSGLAVPVLILAGAGGAAKARFILRKSARRVAERIERRGDGRCLGGFLSWKSWLLVLAMMGFGRLLRASPLPPLVRGGIYAAVGVALLGASLFLWKRWREASPSPSAARP
jgi:hypothetical protein